MARVQVVKNLDRIEGYLRPRIPYLNRPAISLAMQNGDKDMRQSMHARAQCYYRCDNNATIGPDVCVESCYQKSTVIQRVAACSDMAWLPK